MIWTRLIVFAGMLVCICLWRGSVLAESPVSGDSAGPGMDGITDVGSYIDYFKNLKVANPATLTRITPWLRPAAVTVITSDMLRTCGARRIDEALEIFVPNLQLFRHHFDPDKPGIRGVVISKFNKTLFLINGRIINDKFSADVYPESDLPTLDEIQTIEVIRGPGSAVLGPGAVAGVISITTFNGENHPGWRVSAKGGAIEEFGSLQATYGKRVGIGDLLVSTGFTHYRGASPQDAPVLSGDEISHKNISVSPGGVVDPIVNKIPNDRAGLEPVKYKAHAQFNTKHTESWLTVLRGGEYYAPRRGRYGDTVNPTYYSATLDNNVGAGYFVAAAKTKYEQSINEDINGMATVSANLLEYSRQVRGANGGRGEFRYTRQETYYGKALSCWTPAKNHQVGLALDFTLDVFGAPALTFEGTKNTENFDSADIKSDDPFTYTTIGLIAEYQGCFPWGLSLISGGRIDRHSFAGWLYSPRFCLTKKISDIQRVKLIANRSNRINNGDIMRKDENRDMPPDSIRTNEHEVIHTAEVRYEWNLLKEWEVDCGAFYNYYIGLIEFNNSAPKVQGSGAIGATQNLGDYEAFGWEMEARYSHERNRFAISQAYYKLYSFTLNQTAMGQDFTASPYGYGDDLTNWCPNESKVSFHRQHSNVFGYDASVRCFWDFPGQKSWSDYNNQMVDSLKGINPAANPAQTEYTSKAGYYGMKKMSIYLNLGVGYDFHKGMMQTRIDALNVLGWVDRDLNKRNYIKRTADVRIMAPAVMVTVTTQFK